MGETIPNGKGIYSMRLGEVFGHDTAVRMLRQTLGVQRLAGSYLITGPPGVGKTTLARALAQAAACLTPFEDPYESCGACASCRAAEASQHPEITLIPPAGDATQIWQFWDRDQRPTGALQRTLSYSPVVGRKRGFIIERAETLTLAAANSLLKVLEEPPSYAFFMLLAPNPARLIPTVVSRCQVVRLLPAPVEALADFLVAKVQLDPTTAQKLAEYAEGCSGTALRLAGDHRLQHEIDRILDVGAALPGASSLGCLRLADELRRAAASMQALLGLDTESAPDAGGDGPPPEEAAAEAPRDRAGRGQIGLMIEIMAGLYRDLLTLNLSGASAPILHVDRRKELMDVASQREPAYWIRSLEALLEARRRVDQNVNLPLLVDGLAMRLVVG